MPERSQSARVHIVGAGPGDPGLMTRRSLELVARADAILYDRLIPPGALDGARPDALLEYVGKGSSGDSGSQAKTTDRLVELGRSGKRVVRLKGGDPFVFGRGGEEAEALGMAGVPFEIVPGVTAGVAAPAYAGIPVTHRDRASAVAFVTAHADPARQDDEGDWPALAAFPGTLVFYMGVARLGEVAARLIAEGVPPERPAAVVERGTMPGQRTVLGTVTNIAARAGEAGIEPPAITVVGDVAGLADQLAWIERRPLHGRVVAVTRARAQASLLAAQLRELGAEVIEIPAIRTVPRPVDGGLAAALDSIADFALVCVTSPSGAELLMEGLAERGLDARALAGATVAAIGPATAHALAERGVCADVVPEKAVAEALVEALAAVEVDGRRALVARAAEARDVLVEGLARRGADVLDLALYDTVTEALSDDHLEALGRTTDVTFTSSSAVRNLTDALAAARIELSPTTRIVSIGPVTSVTARERGLDVHAEAESHDIDGLVEALLDAT